ncbi:antibiotic ABC transporter ATP-binding protein [Staphylococcus microti]|uniref:ABC transporter ATP-binding protein n=1 Tax=Staphylococcus microti TaxID=569857 RepID=A0A0D6XQZ0_9STAP|nr:ABC transporter ATP-binding protein [Staphylococcus microti]KIX91007.1 antibiotic ABC transporter ATP-binding protein [Staphylococcus microti]PNZ81885.1 ABC transporter ATP-binding protein [Staphylococcus microti]SUM57194.1 ABC transporter ATP-binding protein [Staphylococcus microti]
MIEVQQITKVYGEKKVLDNVSFQLNEGTCMALIGPNGAGKSTLIDVLIGNLHASSGAVKSEHNLRDKQHIGILYQKTSFPEYVKVKELFQLYRTFYKNSMSFEMFQRVTRFNQQKLNQYASNLSGGEARLLDFALSIMGNPRLMILDEPTSAMDTETRQHFWQLIEEMKRQGKTILYTSHYIEEVERMADRVVVLDQGRLKIDSTPHQIRYQQMATHIQLPYVDDKIISEIAKMESVSSANDNQEGYLVVTTDVTPIIQLLIAHHIDLNQIEISKSSLLDTLFSADEEEEALQ